MFSDRQRRVKLGIALTVLVASGIFHNINWVDGGTGSSSYDLRLMLKSRRTICLQNVKISCNGEQFLAVTRDTTLKLLNLPKSVQKDCTGDYAIQGTMIQGNALNIERIRRKHSKFLKVVYSIITAIYIGFLFLRIFRISSKGFYPKKPF